MQDAINDDDPDQDMTLLPIMVKSPNAVREAQWSLYALSPKARANVIPLLPLAAEIVETTINLTNAGRPDLRGTVSGIERTAQTASGGMTSQHDDEEPPWTDLL